ncbi:MAG: hypothetical protein V2A77_08560 [Pseudomonadota bacterium]
MADLKAEIMVILAESKQKRKKLKPNEVVKKVQEKMEISKEDVKTAIKELANEGKIVYVYAGGSFVELPS